MGWKHKRKQEPYRRAARDTRQAVHVYHPVDGTHRLASQGGRCIKCSRITDCFCDKCHAWVCPEHLIQENGIDVCEKCEGKQTLNELSF